MSAIVDGRGRHPIRGIALALMGFAVWTVMDVLVKLLADRYHTFQIIVINSLIASVVVLVPVVASRAWERLRTARPGLQVVRGLLFGATSAGIFWALGRLPIADVYALLFTIPLWVTALSVPMHKAQVGWRRWTAILVGFAGVLVMLRPGGDVLQIASLAVLASAVAESLALLTIRWFPPDESAEAMTIWPYLVMIPMAAVTLPWVGVVALPSDLPVFVAAGICAGVGSLMVTQAYRDAAAATVAPFQYSQMPYGIAIGLVLFGDVPAWPMLLGAAIVIGSGLYILHRETLKARLAAATRTS